MSGHDTALLASEELNRRMIEAMPGGVVHVRADGAILQANGEALRILGLSYDRLTEKYTSDFASLTVWEDGTPCPVSEYPVTKAIVTGQAQPPATIGVRAPDGRTSWAVFTAVPVIDPTTGEPSGAVVTFLDVTEQKRIAAELRDSEAVDPGPTKPEAEVSVETGFAQTRTRTRILVVDDEAVILKVMQAFLRAHDVTVARSGREAIEVLASTEFDLVFCDLMMPDLGGIDVYEHLVTHSPGRERQIVFMTGGAFTERAANFLRTVPNEILDKPFSGRDIQALVARRLTAE